MYRPHYPDELYAYLAHITTGHDVAWDCATGSGQAAVGLSNFYKKVIATDSSQEQLKHAVKKPNIEYIHSPAEKCPLPDASVDLVVVAQAVHWFNLDAFFKEVQRVLKPGGVIALWGYKRTKLTKLESLNSIIRYYNMHTLANYWAPEVRMVNESYQAINFPFKELSPPKFNFESDWTLDQMMGYMYSWSATQNYIQEKGENPLGKVRQQLAARWGGPEATRTVVFRLHFRIGRKE